MRLRSSSPGKVILFGEHAVVYGKPCLSSAISLRTRIECEESTHPKLISEVEKCPYFEVAIRKYGKAIKARAISQIPPSSGLGSSAAFTVSLVSCLEKMGGNELSEERIAKRSFEIEYEAQGRASPNDTSVSTHGNGILISNSKERGLLWEISRGGITWYVHHVEVPEIELAVVYTGSPSDTAGEVAKVRERYEREEGVRRAIDEIGEIVWKGYDALKENDLEKLGELMNKNHELLRRIGVSNEILDSLVKTLRRSSYGAKLTGAGGGGSVIAIPKEKESLKEISRKFKTFLVKLGEEGMRLEGSF